MDYSRLNKGWRSLVALVLVVTVSACVSNSSRNASLTPAEQQMRQESAFFTKSSVEACLTTGLVIGVAAALLSGGRNRGRNAALGFAAGCGVGMGVNAYVQNKRQQYRSNEQRISAMIADLRQENQRLSRLVSTSEQVMRQDRERIAEIDRAYQRKAISLGEARQRMARVRDNRDHLQSTLEALQEKREEWRKISTLEARGGADTAGLDAEIAKLEQQVEALEGEIDLMDEQIAASPVPA